MSKPSPGYSITVRVTAPVGAGTTAALAYIVPSVFDAAVAPAVAAAVCEVAGKGGESDV